MSKTLRRIILILALVVMAYSVYQLGVIVYDYARAHRDNKEMTAVADGTEADGSNMIISYLRSLFDWTRPDNQTDDSLEWAQARVIDFAALQAKNTDIIAWIYIPNTNIDYAVTQTTNDSFYLHHNAQRRRSSSGSIFLAASASPDFSDKESPLYGHHMRDGSMFGSLPRFQNAEFRRNHQFVFVYTPQATKKYQVFEQRVVTKGKLPPNPSDAQTLTLITCDYSVDDARYFVRAKLVSTTQPGQL